MGRCSMSVLLSSAGKKNPNKLVNKGNEVDLVITLTEKMHFLLVVVMPFRSFWFVLLNSGGLEFLNYQSAHRALLRSVCACKCCLLFPNEKDNFNKLIRWNFPIQSLSGNGSTAWHVRNENMCLHSF